MQLAYAARLYGTGEKKGSRYSDGRSKGDSVRARSIARTLAGQGRDDAGASKLAAVFGVGKCKRGWRRRRFTSSPCDWWLDAQSSTVQYRTVQYSTVEQSAVQ